MENLYIGLKLSGWDTAVFAVSPEERRIFGVSTERVSRYKHDPMPPYAVLPKLMESWQIDPGKVRNVFAGNCLLISDGELTDPVETEIKFLLREALEAPYLADFDRKQAEFNALSPQARLERLVQTPSGRRILDLLPAKGQRVISTGMMRDRLSAFFPNAAIHLRSHDHEFCHALSSYYSCGWKDGLLVTMDGYGDAYCFSRAYVADEGSLTEISSSSSDRACFEFGRPGERAAFVTSIGGLYSWFTWLLGYKPHADEGKVEALAAFGQPIPRLRDALMAATRIDPATGAIRLDAEAIESLCRYDVIKQILDRMGREAVAATIQAYLEDSVLAYVETLVRITGRTRLMLSGGVFANVILNLKIFERITPDIFIVPAMADDGAAQGACYAALLEHGNTPADLMWLKARELPYFGTSHDRKAVQAALSEFSEAVVWTDLGDGWPEHVAERLEQDKVGAIFHGCMEWGPRALGNRSILADPRPKDITERINREIKRRPLFQPFCPSILIEEKDRLFGHAYNNKHMTCAFRMREEFWDALPGAVHIDGTSRVQFVSADDNPAYHRLIRRFAELSGYGVVLNTSFNKHGRTIVESPRDAIVDFLDTDLPFLCIEGILVTRRQE